MSEELIKNPFATFEDKADSDVPTATLKIYEFIHEYLGRKQDTYINRASAATMCHKRRWYQRQGYEGTPLTPRKSVNFLLGDLSEKVMQYFISRGCVGPGNLYSEVDFGKPIGSVYFQNKEIIIYQQDDLVADIGGISITAHVDGWGKRNSDGKWELIECKSAANWGFKDFQLRGPKDYLKQAMVNLQTNRAHDLNAIQVRFFYLRKETGHLWDRLCSYDSELAKEVSEEYKIANEEKEPKTPHFLIDERVGGRGKDKMELTGKRVAQFPCSYCPYLSQCHGEYSVEWKVDQWGNKTPSYVFNKKEKE